MRKDLTEGSILRNIIYTAYPLIIAFAVRISFNIVDAIYVGRISAEAIGAVSLAFPLMFFMFAIAGGIGTGASSLIARLLGAKKISEAKNVAEHAIAIGIVLSILFTAFGYLGSRQILRLMGAGSLLELGYDYMSVIFLGSSFSVLLFVIHGFFRAEGDTKASMNVMIITAVANIILDPIFIFALGMGVKGAAIATIISNIIGLSAIIVLLNTRSSLKPRLKDFRYDFSIVREIFKVGIPSSLADISMSLGLFILIRIISTFGPYAITAMGIGFRLDSVAILPAIGVMGAVLSIAGQNYGAKKFERVCEAGFKGAIISGIAAAAVGLAFMLFPKQFVFLFNAHPEVVKYAVMYLRIVSLTYIMVGINVSLAGAFLGAGNALPILLITSFRIIIVSPGLAYLLGITLGLGVAGVWWAIMISQAFGGISALIWFRLWDPAKHSKVLG